MDFFGILFDMKNGKKIPYSKTYFDTLFAESLAGVTTITGTLPLTFTTSETALRSWTIYGADIEHVETATGKSITFYTDEDKLRDWTIYGNNTPHNYSAEGTLPLTFTTHTAGAASDWVIEGNNSIGKNLLEITASAVTKYEVTFTPDRINGTILATGQCNPPTINQAQYDFGGGNKPIPDSFRQALILEDYGLIDGTQLAIAFYDSSNTYIDGVICDGTTKSRRVTIPDNAIHYKTFVRKTASAGNADVTFKPMLRPANTTSDFEPYQLGVGVQTKNKYGYQIPLIVSQTGQPDKTYDIFIGDTPLTEGETVSKQSTGVDIELFNGENTVSTTLYNKPETSITYTDYIGVGEYVNGQWQIPLTVSDGTNTTTVNIPIDAPLTASDTATKTSTGVDIATTDGNNTITTSLSNQPDMSITFNEFTGVGIHVGGLFMIALKLVAGGQTLNVFNTTLNKPLRAGETLTSEQTGQTINTVAGVENKLSPAPKAAAYGGNFEMTIKFKE